MRCSLLASLAVLLLAPGCYQAHELGRGDAGPRADGGDGGDGGGAVSCDMESLPVPSGPRCSEAVSACRDACADDTCRDACLDDACRACFYGTLFQCANAAGCEPLWRSFACCVESVPMCTDLRGFDRVRCAPSCPMLFQPYATCIESMGGMACFMRAFHDCDLH